MLIDAMDMIRGHIKDPEIRAEFGAEGIRISFAFALLNARESAGMTQAELAEHCGVSQAYISRLESGEANPTIGKLGSIFAAMWMEPTIGFGPLLPERSDTTSADTETRQESAPAPSQPTSVPVDTALSDGRRPETVSVDD